MGSVESDRPRPTMGTFTIPVLDGEPHSDPTTRPYMAPPKPKRTIQYSLPLEDFRSKVFKSHREDADFMACHGFTAVKHTSSVIDRSDFQDPDKIKALYYPEVIDLVKSVTGCKTVFVTNSTTRGGAPPTDLDSIQAYKGVSDVTKRGIQMNQVFHNPSPMQPIRLPHCDSTALGGRQSIRTWMEDITAIATERGIIDYEDKVCPDPTSKDSKDVFETKGGAGPRYAAFSIWRPIKPVTRDPLAMAPWSEVQKCKSFVIEPYLNRNQGFDGDWTRELAMLKVKPDVAASGLAEEPKFYYVSNMQPDEVLFVKMFDTAGLGEGSEKEVGCLHGSPDLGEDGYGEDRESVEIRCMAFW